jgi:PPOX class probable F420-dependent enzyme
VEGLNTTLNKKGRGMLDVTTEWGRHAEQRLLSNIIAWLTTVGSDGRPYTVPVWFLWEGNTILIFSQPHKQKIRNLSKNARVTLALDDTKQGDDVVIVEGTAELLDNPEISVMLPAYVEKYGALIQDMGWTPASMAADYSCGIQVTPTKFKSWI